MNCGVYCFRNIINNKIYIGKSENIKRRYNEHKSHSNTKNYHFYNAIRKYGFDNFEFFILEDNIEKSELYNSEQFYIAYYKMIGAVLYNTGDGGPGRSGAILSQKTKDKIGIANFKGDLEKVKAARDLKTKGFSITEIAALLELPRGTVGNYIYRRKGI